MKRRPNTGIERFYADYSATPEEIDEAWRQADEALRKETATCLPIPKPDRCPEVDGDLRAGFDILNHPRSVVAYLMARPGVKPGDTD